MSGLKYHLENCTCCFCRSKRGETKGKNNPMYGKKHKSISIAKNKLAHIGENSSHYIQKVKFICPYCQKVKYVTPKILKIKKYCSKKCKDNAGQSIQTKTAISNTLKSKYSSGKIISRKGMKGRKQSENTRKKISNSLQKYYGNDLKTMSYKRFRRYILKQRDCKCEQCGWCETRKDGFIPVELHCIDGNHDNRKSTNFIVLCPNHHSLTENYMFYGGK